MRAANISKMLCSFFESIFVLRIHPSTHPSIYSPCGASALSTFISLFAPQHGAGGAHAPTSADGRLSHSLHLVLWSARDALYLYRHVPLLVSRFTIPRTGITFLRISEHGGLLLLVLIDATMVNRIPYRLQHYWGVLLVEITYLLWTVIHGLATDLGNPNRSDNDPETNDDTIYGVLDWENDWQTALIYGCGTVFVLGPILYSIMWSLSNGVCKDRRKYVDSIDERDHRPTVDDVEEGSVFAKWR